VGLTKRAYPGRLRAFEDIDGLRRPIRDPADGRPDFSRPGVMRVYPTAFASAANREIFIPYNLRTRRRADVGQPPNKKKPGG
jgi:hypothetical protein